MTNVQPEVMIEWRAASFLSMLIILAISPILIREGFKAFAIVVTYLSCLTLVKMYVKETMNSGLNCPDFITMTHMFSSAIAAFMLERPSTKEAMAVLPISAVNGISLLLNNTAFLYGGVAFISMVSCTTPIFTFILEMVRSKRALEFRSSASVLLVVLGAILCVHGEKVAAVLAFVLASAATFFRASKSVLQQDLLTVKVTPLNLVFWSSLWSFLFMIPIMVVNEGSKGFYEFEDLPHHGKTELLMSILAACTLNISQCFAIKQLGALMQSIVGNLNLILVIVLSQAWLHESVSMWQYVGVCLLAGGTFMNKMVDNNLGDNGKGEKPPTVQARMTAEQASEGGDYNSMGHSEAEQPHSQIVKMV